MSRPLLVDIIQDSNSSSTTASYTLPNSSVGDLIQIVCASDAAATHIAPVGFSQVSHAGPVFTVHVMSKVAVGGDSGAVVTGSLSAAESTNYIALSMSGAHGDVSVSALATASGDTADPPALSPAWGAGQTLWLAAAVGDYWDRVASVYPMGSTNQTASPHKDQFGGTQAISLALIAADSATLDPSSFTLDGVQGSDVAAITIAVRAAVATDTINTINGGVAVTDGQTGVPFTYTGFAAAITSILLDTAGNSVPALNVVDNRDGTGSFDMPSIAGIISDAGTDVVNFGVISTLFAGIQSASKALTVAVAAGYEEVVLAGLETTDTNYLYQVMLADRTLANGESVYYATAAGTIAADGQISMVGDSMNIIVITAGRVAKPYTLLIASIGSGTTKTFDISIGISI